jgi:hypothetical protein
MHRHLVAAPTPRGGRTSGYATYMSLFGDVQTSWGVYGRVNIRLGAFLSLPVVLVLLIRGAGPAPALAGAALAAVATAGSATYRWTRSQRS